MNKQVKPTKTHTHKQQYGWWLPAKRVVECSQSGQIYDDGR